MKSITKITGIVICLLISFAVHAAGEAKPLDYWKQKIRKNYPDVTHIDVVSLHNKLQQESDDIILLDVRRVDEFNISHLRNAMATPSLSVAIKNLHDVDKDRLIIAYCSVGYRSAKLVDELIDRGYSNVFNLEGSIFEWANSGYLVYREEEAVKQVHPYGLWWGRYLRRDLWAWE